MRILCQFGICIGLAVLPSVHGQQPDNTKVNKADRDKGAVTADQQKETKADRELAQKVRSSLTSDKTLSTYAHNVKVIVRDGVVTLRGPVRSDQEKTAVEEKARLAAGKSKVQSEISIAPERP